MKKAFFNFKSRLGELLAAMAAKADLRSARNKTRLGWCQGEIEIHGDLAEPMIPGDDWDGTKAGF